MSDNKNKEEKIFSNIWEEQPEENNPFATKQAFCSGYDVYGDILKKANYFEYIYLLFMGEKPSQQQATLFEGIAIAIANPGPRDHSIRAAMNGGAGGSTSASCLMAALGVGAGQFTGAREIYEAINIWHECGQESKQWHEWVHAHPKQHERADIWLPGEHIPGFDPYGVSCATTVKQVLSHLESINQGGALSWLQRERETLESIVKYPLSMTGVIAAAMVDLGISAEKSEMLYLLLRLPGAAVHALEQKEFGWRRYPFFSDGIELMNDPGPQGNPGEAA